MEVLLNLVWLVIAFGSVCLWRGVWRRGNAPDRREWVAVAVLLFLLFPVISLTDDLHEELAVAECATGTKHFLSSASQCASHQNAGRSSAGHLGAIWNPPISAPASEGVPLQIDYSAARILPALQNVTGRAPPKFLS